MEVKDRIMNLEKIASDALADLERIAHEHELEFSVRFNGNQQLHYHKHTPDGPSWDDEEEEIFGYEMPSLWYSSSMYC